MNYTRRLMVGVASPVMLALVSVFLLHFVIETQLAMSLFHLAAPVSATPGADGSVLLSMRDAVPSAAFSGAADRVAAQADFAWRVGCAGLLVLGAAGALLNVVTSFQKATAGLRRMSPAL